MNTRGIYSLAGMVLGISALIGGSAQNASAGVSKGTTSITWGYHNYDHGYRPVRRHERKNKNKHYRKYTKKKKYVEPKKHSHDYDFYGVTYSLPFGTEKVRVNGNSYHYHNGSFYRKCSQRGYDLVRAPHGAVIRSLPSNRRTSYRHGKKYYRHNDTYYSKVRRGHGYKVVKEPYYDIAYGHGRQYRGCSHGRHR